MVQRGAECGEEGLGKHGRKEEKGEEECVRENVFRNVKEVGERKGDMLLRNTKGRMWSG